MGVDRGLRAIRLIQSILPDPSGLTSSYCSNCKEPTSIVNLSGKIDFGVPVITGQCSKCGLKLKRVSFFELHSHF